MKTLIIHDRFQFRGGAERLVLIMAESFKADILTEFWLEDETYEKSEAPSKIFTLAKNDLKIDALRYFRAQFNFIFKTRKIIQNSGYDLIIFSGNNCLSAAIHLKNNQKHFLYCHSPVRHVFDLFKKRRAEQNNCLKKLVYYDIGAWGIRFIYWLGLMKFKKVVANSQNVAERLQKYCHKRSVVVWPPIETEKFKWLSQKDYYLSFARLSDLKRVDDIVRAFKKMPDKKLVVASSGEELENIKKLADGSANIQILGWVSDERLAELVGNCIASIYVPIDEDAGMTQLESMAAGKPVVVVNDGGLKETVVDEIHGRFVPAVYTIDDIIEAVNWLTADRALAMRIACEKQAEKYSKERFFDQIKQVIEEL